jgi:acyl-coenzyme A thioesterase PaaI-like protein
VYTAMAIDTDFNGAEYITFNLINEDLGFSIDNATGDVTTNADFAADYEDTELQSFTVVATDAAGNSSEQVVSVAINNLDEVAPSITSGDTATAVNENSGADQVVYTATADDSADTSDGVTFSLADEALGFSIDTATGVVTTNDDFTAGYEYAQSQSFTLVATDAAGNASEQVVSVAINNLDEVAPSITSGDTATAIDENSGEGQVVYTATASDTDFNGLEDITFSLADNSLGFSIDADGVVTTNASFEANYEDAQSQSFTVVATDATGNFSEQVVSVAINNLDEAAPSITSGDTATDIDENSGEGQVVYTATATDDADASDGFSFSLADESVGFSIDASTGVVTTNADFAADYEDAQSQSFTVIATDVAGNAADNAGQVVSVAINNLDEVAPSITSGDTADAINENTGTGQVVYAATADDSADISAGVTFSLTDSDPALSIDPSTGAVTLSADADVDYETQSQYSFTVVASDGVNDAVEQSVTLDINNLDEIPPTISLIQYLPIIDENSQSGQIAFESLAIDDSDISGGVTFSLSSGSDPALSIDPNTGIITLWHSPDYEQQSEYNFTVIATDAAGNSSEPLSETFEINNLDEVAPSITSGDTATAIN